MTSFAMALSALAAVSLLIGFYAYVGYPLLLRLMPARPAAPSAEYERAADWPPISIVLPVYNEAHTVARTIENLLSLDYPSERRQIVVVSDASTDGTDEIVRGYADRGVEFHRLPTRQGKTAAENASRSLIRGELVVNTDASVRIERSGLKPLVAAFRDPTVGVASGRDVSIGPENDRTTGGESGYVGYEMAVRDLETRVGGIVGASGCFFASRADLHSEIVPSALSRDFAAPLIARENGYRSVSVPDAVCYVPRTTSLRREYRRKIRTMTRGLETLYYKRALLNPLRYGLFAFMLWSHKLIRWLVPWAALGLLIALGGLAIPYGWLRWPLGGAVAGAGAIMALTWWWPGAARPPAAVMSPAYVLFGLVAGLVAWTRALKGELNPVWEPTRRAPVPGRTREETQTADGPGGA